MSGIPDGLGAYKDNHNNLVVMMNHETGRTFPALPPGVDTRISRVVINGKNRTVQNARYAFTGAEAVRALPGSSTLEVGQWDAVLLHRRGGDRRTRSLGTTAARS